MDFAAVTVHEPGQGQGLRKTKAQAANVNRKNPIIFGGEDEKPKVDVFYCTLGHVRTIFRDGW